MCLGQREGPSKVVNVPESGEGPLKSKLSLLSRVYCYYYYYHYHYYYYY